MFNNEKILFFGGSDWWYHPNRSGMRLLKEYRKAGNEALYVNSIPLRAPKLGVTGSGRRYLNKVKSLLRFLKRSDEGIWVLTPVTLPGAKSKSVRQWNTRLLRFQLWLCRWLIGWGRSKPVIFAATPAAALVLPYLKSKASIYHMSDKYEKFRDFKDADAIVNMDQSVKAHVDAVVCVSQAIFEATRAEAGSRCHYIPHGVNFDLFYRAFSEDLPVPADIGTIPRPIVGYFGSITESNDKEILEHIATARPRWSIVLIGQVVSDYSRLARLKNVYFLGHKPLERLPEYGRQFDVCIMNWVLSEWISFCNPVKAQEYLAMGKPVVSVAIPEVVDMLSDVVAVAHSPDEFLSMVEHELQTDTVEKQRIRIDSVRENTWRARAEQIADLVADKVEQES